QAQINEKIAPKRATTNSHCSTEVGGKAKGDLTAAIDPRAAINIESRVRSFEHFSSKCAKRSCSSSYRSFRYSSTLDMLCFHITAANTGSFVVKAKPQRKSCPRAWPGYELLGTKS